MYIWYFINFKFLRILSPFVMYILFFINFNFLDAYFHSVFLFIIEMNMTKILLYLMKCPLCSKIMLLYD